VWLLDEDGPGQIEYTPHKLVAETIAIDLFFNGVKNAEQNGEHTEGSSSGWCPVDYPDNDHNDERHNANRSAAFFDPFVEGLKPLVFPLCKDELLIVPKFARQFVALWVAVKGDRHDFAGFHEGKLRDYPPFECLAIECAGPLPCWDIRRFP